MGLFSKMTTGGAIFGSALVGAGASLFGNKQNAKAMEAYNQGQKEIAQMNNEFNERMLQKQMDYNTDMWNKENEYNSAESQRKRLEEAGLNPYLMMNGGSAGTASSAQGVTPPTASPSNMQPMHYDYSGVGNAFSSAVSQMQTQQLNEAAINKTTQEAEGVRIENKYKAAQIVTQLYNMLEDTKGKSKDNLAKDLMNFVNFQSMPADIAYRYHQAQGMQISNVMMMANAIYRMKELSYFDENQKAAIANVMADTAAKGRSNRTEIFQALQDLKDAKVLNLSTKELEQLAGKLLNVVEKQGSSDNPYNFVDKHGTRLFGRMMDYYLNPDSLGISVSDSARNSRRVWLKSPYR